MASDPGQRRYECVVISGRTSPTGEREGTYPLHHLFCRRRRGGRAANSVLFSGGRHSTLNLRVPDLADTTDLLFASAVTLDSVLQISRSEGKIEVCLQHQVPCHD
jgi:hypothetical protein